MLTKYNRRITNARRPMPDIQVFTRKRNVTAHNPSKLFSPNDRDKKAGDLKVLLCAFAKCENLYLSEWVDYNFNVGFDHIILFDNNEKNGERPQDVLSDEQMSRMTFVDVRGQVETAVRLQTKCYTKCYNEMTSGYDWVSFLDIDEFITLPKHDNNIKKYLSDPRFKDYEGIRINWMNYGDNGKVNYEKGNVLDRFTEPCKNQKDRCDFKTIYRTNIPGIVYNSAHYANEVRKVCDNKGDETPQTANCHMVIKDRSVAYIKHFVTKSLEEFITIKRARRRKGDVAQMRLSKGFYYTLNERTPEKDEMFRKLLGV